MPSRLIDNPSAMNTSTRQERWRLETSHVECRLPLLIIEPVHFAHASHALIGLFMSTIWVLAFPGCHREEQFDEGLVPTTWALANIRHELKPQFLAWISRIRLHTKTHDSVAQKSPRELHMLIILAATANALSPWLRIISSAVSRISSAII